MVLALVAGHRPRYLPVLGQPGGPSCGIDSREYELPTIYSCLGRQGGGCVPVGISGTYWLLGGAGGPWFLWVAVPLGLLMLRRWMAGGPRHDGRR